ncbi:hypothetical protein LAZ67_19002546 [Cordylochernes scorpioides]|uniref:Integrase catalytic domain-containing protein n=1 Tax=Cordylochernes scorpioides TaxID=51811 RepID=A0ABY6LIW6_9ARAC|nr:hypothetical protein LAZ67_19002546 [Cordylochernes scorpioides]
MASLPSHDVTLNKLDGYNYSLWSFKIEMLLQKEDLWEVVTENIPDEPKIEWKKKDSKARAIINLSIADSQIVHVKNLLTAKATWDTLKNIYERKTLSGKIYLLRKLYSLKLEEDKDMQQHITTMMELVDKLRTIGETLKDSHITAILLCSLPKSYSNLITMLESRPDDELTLEFTKNKLLDEHTRRVESSKDESTESNALKSLHGASSQRREKEKKFCSFCHKPHHSKEECWHYQKRNNSNKEYKYENFRRGNVPKYTNQSSVTQEQSTNQRTTKGPNPKALNCTQREASVHNWFVDSGATSHMAYDESFFTELNREQTQNVVVANGNKLQVKGIGQGEIKVITPQGKTDTLLLTKVLYIPELTDNLLSVSAATSNGCKVTFNRDWCTIERDNTALANGILDNGMYRLHLDDNPQTRTFKANVAKQNHCKNKNCLMLWHDRLGHRNIESIKKIRNENLARGLSLNNCSHSTDCVQCIQGKLTETPFPKKTEYRATETLQLVHSDICGPLPTNSLSGKRYFITFTDDYSRYTKTYLLKGKDEVYEKIKDYVISAHTEFGKNIQTIRTDNGREYVNRQVEDFLNQSGIKHQLTVPYSPAQNGVAEGKNRSLMEMTRCMLFDSGLPQSLWAEAVTTTNYLHNRIPSKATDKTPFELWTNRKPSLKHLKRFGCKAFAYIPKIKRNKLDSKVIEGIFLGYDDRSKGYRILHDTDNITISRSVKFIEKENGFHLASTKTTSPQVLSTDLTSSNHIGHAEESQEPGTQSAENLEDSETEDYIQPGTSTGTQVVTQRRSTRPTKGIPPIRNDYVLYKTEAQDIQTPTSYSEVLQLPKIERDKWLQAMNEELNSLEKNNVWELTPLPKDKKIIGCKWTYKQKLNSKGEIERYKARLVAKGFNQKFGRDYEETFAPIVKHSTIRAFLAASVYKGMQVIHLDVKTAFLHGDLDKELYMELPEGLHTKQTNKVCKLKKAIYGLKQAGRSWNTKIASTLIKNNFKQSIVDPCLFTKNEENHSIYLILYVDDMLLASDSEIIIQNTVKTLEKEFEIKNLGDPLNSLNKIQELVERYNLQEAKPTFTPMESGYPGISDEKLLPNNVQYQQLIGSLLYLSVVSRPDIAAPVCILSSRNQNPRNCDWNAAKRIVRYLKTTKELELRISNQKPPTLEAYSDATWASDNTDRKSLSGNLFLLGSNPISWMTGKQGCVSLSSTEAELISAAEASQELLWLLDLLKDLELEQKAPIYFHQDNQSCLKICSSEKVSSRTKHIATKIHHLKDLQKKTVIKMVYCPTGDMKADILTKPLPRPTFEKLRYNLVMWYDQILLIECRAGSHEALNDIKKCLKKHPRRLGIDKMTTWKMLNIVHWQQNDILLLYGRPLLPEMCSGYGRLRRFGALKLLYKLRSLEPISYRQKLRNMCWEKRDRGLEFLGGLDQGPVSMDEAFERGRGDLSSGDGMQPGLQGNSTPGPEPHGHLQGDGMLQELTTDQEVCVRDYTKPGSTVHRIFEFKEILVVVRIRNMRVISNCKCTTWLHMQKAVWLLHLQDAKVLFDNFTLMCREWAYAGVDPDIPGNGGPDCVGFLSPTQRAVETLGATALGLWCLYHGLRGAAMESKLLGDGAPTPDRGGKRALTVFLSLIFGMEMGFKLASRTVVYILNPCHLITFIQNASAFVIKTGSTTQWQADLAPKEMATSDMRNRPHVQPFLTWSTNTAHPCVKKVVKTVMTQMDKVIVTKRKALKEGDMERPCGPPSVEEGIEGGRYGETMWSTLSRGSVSWTDRDSGWCAAGFLVKLSPTVKLNCQHSGMVAIAFPSRPRCALWVRDQATLLATEEFNKIEDNP